MDKVEVYKKTLFVSNFFDWMLGSGNIYYLMEVVEKAGDEKELEKELELEFGFQGD